MSGIRAAFEAALNLGVLFLLIRKPSLLPLVLPLLLLIATEARFQNPAVEASSTHHLFGLLLPTMIRCSDSPTPQGGEALNQPSDGLSSTRVAHELPRMRTSCA